MKFLSGLTFLILVFLFYGFYISQYNISPTFQKIKPENASYHYDYKGVINVQSNLSKGSSDPLEIVKEAKLAELDYLILTDKDQFNTEDIFSGYHDGVLYLNQSEYSFLDSRIIYIDPDSKNKPSNSADSSIFLTNFLSEKNKAAQERILYLAQPYVNGNPTWTGSYPEGLDGVEILNPRAISGKAWQRSKLNVMWSLMVYFFNPEYSFLRLFSEPREELSLWDMLNEKSMSWGFAGADASAKAIPFSNWLIKFPSYKSLFEITTNHVLLTSELVSNFSKDKMKILSALKKGNFYTSIDLLGNPKGFYAIMETKDKNYLMGSKLSLQKALKLKIGLPNRPHEFFEIVIIKDGQRLTSFNDHEVEYEITEPGVYRVQVRIATYLPIPDGSKWISWIYSNPFFVNR